MENTNAHRQKYIDYIRSEPGGVTSGDVARYMKVSASAARENLSAMSRAGYLERFNAPNVRGITEHHYKVVTEYGLRQKPQKPLGKTRITVPKSMFNNPFKL